MCVCVRVWRVQEMKQSTSQMGVYGKRRGESQKDGGVKLRQNQTFEYFTKC